MKTYCTVSAGAEAIVEVSGSDLSDLIRDAVSHGAAARFRASGASMSPFLREGDVVTVSPLAGRQPRLGDVAAFVEPATGKCIVHRVVGTRLEGVLIQGDAREQADGWMDPSQILGRVSRVERDGRRVGLGFGPERRAIALSVRWGFVGPLRSLWHRLRPRGGYAWSTRKEG